MAQWLPSLAGMQPDKQGTFVWFDCQDNVKVCAKPDEGAANKAVLELLAQVLGTAPSRLSLLRGTNARDKLIQLG